MAEYMIQGETLTAIANAIREKTGGTANLSPEQMAAEISNISAGGALPIGISALASGTYTSASNASGDLTITHNLGKVPNFAILLLCDDISTNIGPALAILYYFQLYKPIYDGSNYYNVRGNACYIGSSGTLNTTNVSSTDDSLAPTENTVTFKGHSTGRINAGSTYRWVVGVIDGIG